VSLSYDGKTLAVGGTADNGDIGAVWVWTRGTSLNSWVVSQKIVGNYINSTGQVYQGESVSLSSDGNILAFGGSMDCGGIGATWVYRKIANVWTQQSKLIGTSYMIGVNPAIISQGCSVSVSSDGSTIAVGGKDDKAGIGATWVFFNKGDNVWRQQGEKIVALGATGAAAQGTCVELSDDGGKLIISAMNDDSKKGCCFYFVRDTITSVWAQVGGKLIGSGGSSTGALQGSSISLSGIGSTLIVGARGDNNNLGSFYLFNF
jgi:hypothetical protein